MVEEPFRTLSAVFKLQDGALEWYRSWELVHGRTASWDEFRNGLLKAYRAPNWELATRNALAELIQKGDNSDYVAKFRNLAAQLTVRSEQDLMLSFIRGLKQGAQIELTYRNPKSLEDALHHSMRLHTPWFTEPMEKQKKVQNGLKPKKKGNSPSGANHHNSSGLHQGAKHP